MTESTNKAECEEIQTLMPEYALGALEYDERDSVQEHVRLCSPCRRELGSFEDVADALLVTAPPAAPSAALRRRVLEAAGIVTESEPAPSVRRGIAALLAGIMSPASRLSLLAPAFAAIALVVAVGVAYQAYQLQRDLEQMRSENSQLRAELYGSQQIVAEVLGPGALAWELRGTESAPTARATLYCNRGSKTGVLATTDLPPLPEGRAYQLWLISDGRRTNGGLLKVGPSGRGVLTVQAPEPFGSYQSVGMTEEPDSGSPGPTGQRVLSGQIY